MSVVEGKGLSGVVLGTNSGPLKKDGDLYRSYCEKVQVAKAVVVTSLGDKPLRAVQSARSPKDMWDNLNARYVANTMANKNGVVSSLLRSRNAPGVDLSEFLAELETKSHHLSAI